MTVPPEDVSAVIVTRGDVYLEPILETLVFGEVVIYDNARGEIRARRLPAAVDLYLDEGHRDLGAYGRYAAIRWTTNPIVYVQDDDCTVSPEAQLALLAAHEDGYWLSNMPTNWNGTGMPELALPGWGAIFHRDLAAAALERWAAAEPADMASDDFLRIGCDIVVPVLCPSRMIDLGHENLPHAEDPGRTCKRADYQAKKRWYYETAKALR